MTPKQLLRIVRRLPASTPIADGIAPPAQYKTHKDHWIGWLKEYNGPGFYGRKNPNRDARYIWNHIQNVGMLIWLAEAANKRVQVFDPYALSRAAVYDKPSFSSATVRDYPAARCSMVRHLLPWPNILKALSKP